MGYNLLIHGIYWGYNPLILTFDPNFLGHPSIDPFTPPPQVSIGSQFLAKLHRFGTCKAMVLKKCLVGKHHGLEASRLESPFGLFRKKRIHGIGIFTY